MQSCYYSLNGKVKAKEWYENNQERWQKQAWNQYRNLSGEEKDETQRACKKLTW